MRAFLGLWTAAMLLTAGFGAAGTSPERLIRVIYADAYGAAQVLDGRASLAAQWTEDALRAVWASGTQGLFPTTLGKGAHTRLQGGQATIRDERQIRFGRAYRERQRCPISKIFGSWGCSPSGGRPEWRSTSSFRGSFLLRYLPTACSSAELRTTA